MKRLLIVTLALLFVISACKKDDDAVQEAEDSVLDYMPLKIGNYWVYETFMCDSTDLNCDSQSIDTNLVTKDTIINGYTYYKIEGKYMYSDEPRFYRDSLEYIVDHFGHIIFTHVDSLQTFNRQTITNPEGDTVFYWYYQLTSPFDPIVVEAGSFDCLDLRGYIYRAIDDFQIEHNCHRYYAKDVGPVVESNLFVGGLNVYKRELISYHLE